MAHTTQEIPRSAWRSYFDDLSKHLGTVEATVEVAGRDLGTQVEADRLVLTGMTYDDRDDVLMIALDAHGGLRGELEHLVESPRTILVATGVGDDLAIDVVAAEDHQTIVRIEQPPALPGA